MAFSSSVRALTNDWPHGTHAPGQLIHEEDGPDQPLGLIADSLLIEMFFMYKSSSQMVVWRNFYMRTLQRGKASVVLERVHIFGER